MQLEFNLPKPHEATAEERMDEAMAESFPASDSPSWTSGLSHQPAHPPQESPSEKPEWETNWSEVRKKLRQQFPQLADTDLQFREGDEESFIGNLEHKLGKAREEIETMLSSLA